MHRLCLLTGVTGFIGGELAAQWLQSNRRVESLLLLVRAQSPETGLARVRESIARFLPASDDSQGLLASLTDKNILLGDYTSSLVFLQDPRIGRITEVINCGAIATFGSDKDISKVNVDGPMQLARRVVNNPGFRRFVQVGTAMCCGPLTRRTVHEDYVAPSGTKHIVPYTQSKIDVELRLANEVPGLPLVVARPSIVVGHTRMGCAPNPSLFWIFRLARALKTFTCGPDDVIDVVPVDFVAASLLLLLEKPVLHEKRYHLSAGEVFTNSFGDIERAVAAGLGEPSMHGVYQRQDIEGVRKLMPRFNELIGPCVDFVVMRAIEQYGQFASLSLKFDNTRLLREIAEAQAAGMPGVLPARPFTSYAGLCARTAEGQPIFEQMRFDFKGYSPHMLDRVMARLFG
jgi:nucleoside-diphosphate-sugar epimerase